MFRIGSASPRSSAPTRWVLLCLGVCVLLALGASTGFDLDRCSDADDPDNAMSSASLPSLAVPAVLLSTLETRQFAARPSFCPPTPRPPTL
jgi:hypothetical protein